MGGKKSQKTQKINKKHKMNHTKCTVNTFRNRLWPFNRTRSDKKHLVFTRLLLFFWGADFPNNLRTLLSGLFGSTCTLHLRTFPPQSSYHQRNQVQPDSLHFSRRLQRALSPMGPAAGKTPAEVTRPSRRYF